MGVESDGVTGVITFGANSAIDNLDQKTIITEFNAGGSGGNGFGRILDKGSDTTVGWLLFVRDATNVIEYQRFWDGAPGVASWQSTGFVSFGTRQHFAVSFDRTSTLNSPLMFVSGSSVEVTEIFPPSVSFLDDDAVNLKVGNRGAGGRAFDGIIYKILIYNRLLTEAEVKEDFDSRLFISNFDGLVWACLFIEADGKSSFTGALSNTNFVYDYMGGNKGTPAGSPIAHPETEMAFP